MTLELVIQTDNEKVLLPDNAKKDVKSRLSRFVNWLNSENLTWYNPDLALYRDSLLVTLSPASVNAHLSTVRSQYKSILSSNTIRDRLYKIAGSQTDNALERKAFVEEVLTRLSNAVNPVNSQVETEKKQDVTDNEQIRLTVAQCNSLIRKPKNDTLRGLRDTALIALALATGLREMELCNLEIEDLRQSVNNELGIQVRKGKGCKTRFVPYGDNEQVLAIVDKWLNTANITTGKVFRSFLHHSKTVTDSLSVRGLQDILKQYPIMVNGKKRIVKPHDLRRSYARLLYDTGMDIVSIQQNLGHSNIQTTLTYIGNVNISKRKPKAAIDFNL